MPFQHVWVRRGMFVLCAMFIALQGVGVFFHAGDGIFRYTTRFMLPPAWIGFSPVSYHRVVETAHAFVALGVAPTYQEAFPSALAFVLRDMRVQDLLAEASLKETVMDSEAFFTEEDMSTLRDARISLSEEKRYLTDPLLRVRSTEPLRDTPLPSQEMRLASVQEKIDLAMPFADIARYFSEDSSAMNGGDLGVIVVSDLPAWALGAEDMEIGEVRDGIVGSDAFWMLKMVDKGGEGDSAWVHLRGIAINKPTLGALLRAHASEHPAWIFVW